MQGTTAATVAPRSWKCSHPAEALSTSPGVGPGCCLGARIQRPVPDGDDEGPLSKDFVCKLNYALYGLIQAPML
eukprot:3015581-Rhodomonas_salina.1